MTRPRWQRHRGKVIAVTAIVVFVAGGFIVWQLIALLWWLLAVAGP